MLRRIAAPLALCLAAVVALAPAAHAGEQGAARAFDRLKADPPALAGFLRAMPKGTDLHTHLSGAVYAEDMVGYAAADGVCIDTLTFASSYPPCAPGQQKGDTLLADNVLYNKVLAAWSMRGFTPGAESGHDHFFATFDKFSAALGQSTGYGLGTVAQRAALQHEQYIEPLLTPQFGATAKVAAKVRYTGDFAKLRDELLAAGLLDALPKASSTLDAIFAQERLGLGCDTPKPAAGCRVRVGFDVQVLRANPPVVVFAQLLFGMALMGDDPRWVGMNMVQPEDAPLALRDYSLQMRMIRYLRTVYPKRNITLHAGELAPGVARPSDLRFHVREAVTVAGANRIGHGVDIRWESRAADTLRKMRDRKTCIEINLTSNAQILGVTGKRHPLRTYLAAGVPVTLSTDDEGVERTDLTAQYVQAALDHGLTYRQLKRIARNGLECSFLPAAEKRSALQEQQGMFTRFERRYP